MLTRRTFVQSAAAAIGACVLPRAAWAADWSETLRRARRQTVYFNAWAGSDPINAYIAWAAAEAQARFGFTVTHVKITDAAETVKRVREEVASGKADGTVDLVWINGENFKAMKEGGLLFGPFSESLPNYSLVDTAGKPTTRQDFAESVDGLESPWGMAQLTFFADGAKVPSPPRSMVELAAFAKANPGRVTYPAPPDFHGTTFVKQVLLETVADAAALARPVDEAGFTAAAAPAFAMLDGMRPNLWRDGKQFPRAQADVTRMLADGEVLAGLTFNPNEAANLVAAGTLPATTVAWQHTAGTIGNTHFVAIPVNAQAKEAAQVFADFLLSPEAQARKADIAVWGDPTVLAMAKLAPDDAARFSKATAPGSVTLPGPTLLEPHASWVPLLEKAWLAKYGNG